MLEAAARPHGPRPIPRRPFLPRRKGPGIAVLHRQVPKPLPPGPLLVIGTEDGQSDLWEVEASSRNPPPAWPVSADYSAAAGGVASASVLVEGAGTNQIELTRRNDLAAKTAAGDPLYAVIDRPHRAGAGAGGEAGQERPDATARLSAAGRQCAGVASAAGGALAAAA